MTVGWNGQRHAMNTTTMLMRRCVWAVSLWGAHVFLLPRRRTFVEFSEILEV